ncbi:MAG: RagB/SusD family nutrient uptake outer membrane protein, partial [Paludibacter sp.]|nr:RagB/SusD family nutrient uptake outer membrane protein [Paludibacter sp.]
MKKINLIIAVVVIAAAFTGCSDEFLKEKRDFKKTTDIIYDSYVGAQLRVDNIYALVLPGSAGDFFSLGKNTDEPSSTEESGGLGSFVADVAMTSPPDFFFNEAKTSRSPWGRIRNCNDCIEGILAGSLSQADKEKLLGQVYFLRAWVYYKLVVLHGGVPIIDHTQNPLASEAE